MSFNDIPHEYKSSNEYKQAINKINEWIEKKEISDELDLSQLNLKWLPPLPNTLQKLYCSNNQLTRLPDLPNSLQYLDCDYNELTNLPDLPNTLRTLYCGDNKLTTLPILPNLLEIKCYGNPYNFATLPELPSSLKINHSRAYFC